MCGNIREKMSMVTVRRTKILLIARFGSEEVSRSQYLFPNLQLVDARKFVDN